jgi:hypothetical protein
MSTRLVSCVLSPSAAMKRRASTTCGQEHPGRCAYAGELVLAKPDVMYASRQHPVLLSLVADGMTRPTSDQQQTPAPPAATPHLLHNLGSGQVAQEAHAPRVAELAVLSTSDL